MIIVSFFFSTTILFIKLKEKLHLNWKRNTLKPTCKWSKPSIPHTPIAQIDQSLVSLSNLTCISSKANSAGSSVAFPELKPFLSTKADRVLPPISNHQFLWREKHPRTQHTWPKKENRESKEREEEEELAAPKNIRFSDGEKRWWMNKEGRGKGMV